MTCRRPAHLALALASILLASAAEAQPQEVRKATFDEYASPVTEEYQATIGRPVTSGGLDFYDTDAFTPGARNVLATWGKSPAEDPIGALNQPVNIGSSTAMFATLLGERIDVRFQGSNLVTGAVTPFSFISIDVAHLYSTAFFPSALTPINITFIGFGPSTDNLQIQQAFTIPAPTAVGGVQQPVLTTLTFDERWRAVNGVIWFQSSSASSAHQFTNVVSATVPEPGTVLLVLTGLAGLGAVQLRRRRAAAA
jgi:hypothetical protein